VWAKGKVNVRWERVKLRNPSSQVRAFCVGFFQDRDVGVVVRPEGGVRGKSALALPDAHAVWQGEVKFVSGLDIECRVPRVEVSYRSCPEFVGGMLVGHHCLPKVCFTLL